MTTKQKILQFLDFKGIPKAQFYREANVAPSNFKGEALYSRDLNVAQVVIVLTMYPELSPDWLLLDKGDMLRPINENGVVVKGNSELIDIIREQAEEIGQLKERIAQLEREKAAGGSSALDVDTARSAHAG